MGERMVEGREEEESDSEETAEKLSWFSAAAANFSRKAKNSSEQGINLIFFRDRVKLNENHKKRNSHKSQIKCAVVEKYCVKWKRFKNLINTFSATVSIAFPTNKHFKSLEWNYKLNADEKLHEELELKIDFHNYVCLQDIWVYFDPTRCIHRIKIALTRFSCFLMFSSQQKSFHFQNNQMEFCFGEPMQTDWKAKLLRSLFRAFNTSSIQLRLMVTRAVH